MQWLNFPFYISFVRSASSLFNYYCLISSLISLSCLWALYFLSPQRSCYFYLRLRRNICLNFSFVSLSRGGNHYFFNVSLNNILFFSIFYYFYYPIFFCILSIYGFCANSFLIAYLQLGAYLYRMAICWKTILGGVV